MSEIVEVTQDDRQRMVLYEQMSAIPIAPSFAREVLDGKWDDDRRVQSFARHRIAAEARSHDGEWEAMREALEQVLGEIEPAKRYAEQCGLEGGTLPSAVHIKLDMIAGYARKGLSAVPLFDEGRL